MKENKSTLPSSKPKPAAIDTTEPQSALFDAQGQPTLEATGESPESMRIARLESMSYIELLKEFMEMYDCSPEGFGEADILQTLIKQTPKDRVRGQVAQNEASSDREFLSRNPAIRHW